MWQHATTGEDFPVDAPDTVSASGILRNGVEVVYQVASVPFNASGTRLEIYGRKGTIILTSQSVNIGPSQLFLAKGNESLVEVVAPEQYHLVPEGMRAGPGINVGQAYARFATAMDTGNVATPDFRWAVTRHRLIDAMEQSHSEGKVIRLD